MTGAPLPSAADTVVPVEHTRGEDREQAWAAAHVTVLCAPHPGANVRTQGEDVAHGAVLAGAGDELGARRLAALAAAGIERVSVRRLPRVAVIATGSELRKPGRRCAAARFRSPIRCCCRACSRRTGSQPLRSR
nr:hypothetical protein [Leucobacter luti]